MPDKLLKSPLKNAIQKTLAAQLLSTATTGDPISFDDVDGIDNAPGVLVINRVDSNGEATASKREYIEYSGTSGNTVLITTRNVDGSNAALTHAVGSIVEFIPDVSWANRIYTALSSLIDVDDVSVVNPSIVTNPLSATSFINSSGATISAILDEDTMASNRADAIPTQQSVSKAIGGWLKAGLSGVTVTRQSTDNPTVVLRFNADVTDYIWKGMRIKATENSIVHYFIVSADPVYSAPNTDITCLSEIDTTTPTQAKNLIGATTISDVAYAPPDTKPKGFPGANENWTMRAIDTIGRVQSSPTNGVWHNLGSFSLSVAIGSWAIDYAVSAYSAAILSTQRQISTTLSKANNTQDDAGFTATGQVSGASGTIRYQAMHSRSKNISITSKTTYYLNSAQVTGDGSTQSIHNRNDESPAIIRATSTLL